MRYISRCCLQLGEQSEALQWLYRAVAEAPHLREPYLELARLLYDRGDWDGVVFFCREALRITVRPRTYICESESWGSPAVGSALAGAVLYGRCKEAAEAVNKAAQLAPNDERIANNQRIILACAQGEAV